MEIDLNVEFQAALDDQFRLTIPRTTRIVLAKMQKILRKGSVVRLRLLDVVDPSEMSSLSTADELEPAVDSKEETMG